MRIALVSALYPPEFCGGATLVCERLADEFDALGHECAVFSGRTTAAEPLGAVAQGRIGAASTYRVNVGGALHPWTPQGYWNPVASDAFADFCAQMRPDVVHVHSLQGLGGGLVGVARRADIPVVVTMHDWWWLCPCLFRLSPAGDICPARVSPERCSGAQGIDFAARRATLRAVLSEVAGIVVPSAFLRDSLVENGFDGDRIAIQPNGLPMGAPGPRRAAGAGEDPLRFLFVGGAGNSAKGLGVLLAAAARLDGPFVLDAYSVDAEESRPWDAQLAERLVCRPAFAPARLDRVLDAADVVVVPSLMRESFSLVAHEALARGRPVVASDCGGPEEVVRDGVNGAIVASGSVDALARAMDRLVRDRDRVRELAAAARLQPATPRAQAEASVDLYRAAVRAVARPRPPRPPALGGRRVLFLTGMDGAPLRYRAWNLLERLRCIGMDGEVLYHSDVRAVSAARAADLVVLYRAPLSTTVARVVGESRARGVPVVFSSDDFVFQTGDLADAPALDHPDPAVVSGYRQSVEGHARCLAAADGFLGSTPELAEVAADLGRPAYCVANGLSNVLRNLSRGARERRRGAPVTDGRVRLGYASGTDTHDADLATVAPALGRVLERRPEATLVLVGPVGTPEDLERFGDRIERWPFLAWNELPERLAGLDVNLAPLDTARSFNRGKSEVKLIEAAAVGVPTAASDAPAFVRASRDGEIGLLCNQAGEWAERLGTLVADAALREALGGVCQRDIERRYSTQAQAQELADVVTEILARGSGPARELPEPVALEADEGSEVALEPGDALYDRYQLDAERGGPLGPGAEVEQRFTCERDGLSRVDVRVGTYVRRNEHRVILSVLDEEGATRGERVVPAAHLVDRSFVSIPLARPWEDSSGRGITIRARAPEATAENAILLWHAASPLGGLAIGGVEQPGRTLSFRAFCALDQEMAS